MKFLFVYKANIKYQTSQTKFVHLSVNIFANAVSVGPAAEAVTFITGRSIVSRRTEYCKKRLSPKEKTGRESPF